MKDLSKEKKLLHILLVKEVDIHFLKELLSDGEGLESYNKACWYAYQRLNEEEFEMVREWVE